MTKEEEDDEEKEERRIKIEIFKFAFLSFCVG